MSRRVSGVLLHPTSLPGPFGIGDLGPEAHRFVDQLADAGQGLWQVLPLGPTGYADSPYQCFSAFAGNPLLVSPERLRDDGWLEDEDLADPPAFPEREVDYGAVIAWKQPLLRRAFRAFEERASPEQRASFDAFCKAESAWLDDFALFMAVKHAHDGATWTRWEKPIASRRPQSTAHWRRAHAAEIAALKFAQFEFFRQWAALRAHARSRGIELMGDVPIFVAHDSADVWAHRELFQLAESGEPAVMAGVPPDYFSATGQCWGNPLYRWDVIAGSGYAWWIARFRKVLELVDRVRLDHFRGFEAYWEIPGGETTAVKGRWVKGPGEALFAALRGALGEIPIVAENLGMITPEVEALRERLGFPGMAILQFAFGRDPEAPDFQPHNFPRNRVVYTGTHDNDTTLGWWQGGVGDTTRSAESVAAERDFARRYMQTDGREIHWDCIRTILASVADVAIAPLQDVLGFGSAARMNLPGRAAGNWRWRYVADDLSEPIRARLHELTWVYGRAPKPPVGA